MTNELHLKPAGIRRANILPTVRPRKPAPSGLAPVTGGPNNGSPNPHRPYQKVMPVCSKCSNKGYITTIEGYEPDGWYEEVIPCPGEVGFPCVYTRTAELQAELMALQSQLSDEAMGWDKMTPDEWQIMRAMA